MAWEASSAAAVATAAQPGQGSVGAMTVIALLRPLFWPRRPGGWLRVWVLWRVTRIRDKKRYARPLPRILRPVSLSYALARLGVIHDAHFALIERFPDEGQPRERCRLRLLLFESNYDGGFDDYIDAFSAVIPRWMIWFWGTSYGFPGPRPVTPFKQYISANEFGVDHWYCANPGATARVITSALALARSEGPLRAEAEQLSAAEFQARYEELLVHVQAEL
jgi:hypothetical protein